MTSWSVETINVAGGRIQPGILDALLGSELAIARIPDVAASIRPKICSAIKAAVSVSNHYSNTTLTTVGPYLANNLRQPRAYFDRAHELSAVLGDSEIDPRPIVRRVIRDALGLASVEPLVEPNVGPYAEAVVRLHGDGRSNPLHNDMLSRDAANSGLLVAEARHQLSAIYCVQECSAGGELVLYRRRWRPEDEAWKVKNGLGYGLSVVDAAEAVHFRPMAGDLYLIDPTHYHEIHRVIGQTRITLGSFVMFFDEAPRTAWCLA